MLAIGLSWRGEVSPAHAARYPSPVTLRLMKAPESNALSPKKRATHSLRALSPLGSPNSSPIRIGPSDPRNPGVWAAAGVFFSPSVDGAA